LAKLQDPLSIFMLSFVCGRKVSLPSAHAKLPPLLITSINTMVFCFFHLQIKTKFKNVSRRALGAGDSRKGATDTKVLRFHQVQAAFADRFGSQILG
jgi:hypothetical protein